GGRPKGGGSGGSGGPGGGSSGGSRRTSGGGGGGSSGERGFNNTVVQRPLYKFADANALEKKLVPVIVKLGVSDGFVTEVLEGLAEGDTVITGVIMPGAIPVPQAPGGSSSSNPFSGGRSSFGGSSSRGPSGR
ncbi:MAG: hypothetical protein V4773_28195, partial [Verrucomicrobiota bacterium]